MDPNASLCVPVDVAGSPVPVSLCLRCIVGGYTPRCARSDNGQVAMRPPYRRGKSCRHIRDAWSVVRGLRSVVSGRPLSILAG